jgi:hypothetical protein
MSLAAALLLAAAAAQAAPADVPREPERGVRLETARVSVTILRPAVVKGGVLVTGKDAGAPHSQRHREGGRISYVFE